MDESAAPMGNDDDDDNFYRASFPVVSRLCEKFALASLRRQSREPISRFTLRCLNCASVRRSLDLRVDVITRRSALFARQILRQLIFFSPSLFDSAHSTRGYCFKSGGVLFAPGVFISAVFHLREMREAS